MKRDIKNASSASSSGSSSSSSSEEKLNDVSNHPEQQLTKVLSSKEEKAPKNVDPYKDEEGCSEESEDGDEEKEIAPRESESETSSEAEKEEKTDLVLSVKRPADVAGIGNSAKKARVSENQDVKITKEEDGSSDTENDEEGSSEEEAEDGNEESESENEEKIALVSYVKRSADVGIGNSKNAKKAMVLGNQVKMSPFTRVFSDQDELVLLEGMVKCYTNKGINPFTDVAGFYNHVNDLLQIEVTKLQVSDKIRRMKGKYMKKAAKMGGDYVLHDAHEHETFQLCKQIWENLCVDGGLKSTKAKNSEGSNILDQEIQNLDDEVVHKDGFFSRYAKLNKSLSCDDSSISCFVKKNVHLIGSQKAKEHDEDWKELFIREFELHSKKL